MTQQATPTTPAPAAAAVETIRFMNLELETSADVLVPRPETELLARTSLELIDRVNARCVIDMCCGAGNLACFLAHERPQIRLWASDLTTPCVSLARRNAERLGLVERVDVRQGDLFAPLRSDEALFEATLKEAIDVIVCNPPYISSGKLAAESAHLLEKEPREAFDGGPYGFSIHKRVIQDAMQFLKIGGYLVFEIGKGQEKQIESLFTRAKTYGVVASFCDEEGAPRVMAAQRCA